MPVKIIESPKTEPVSLDELKRHLRIVHDDEDDTLLTYLKSATRYAESTLTWRAFVEQELELTLDKFADEIRLPRPPLLEVTSFTYFDKDNVEQTVDSDIYIEDTDSEPGRIIKADGKIWPSDLRQINAVKIRYKAGYPPHVEEVEDEDVGTGDDDEKVFTLEKIPVQPDSEEIEFDGVATTDYSIDYETGEITFDSAPSAGVAITADYTQEDFRINIPQEIKQGVLILAGHFFEVREPVIIGTSVMTVPFTVEALLMPWRAWGGEVK